MERWDDVVETLTVLADGDLRAGDEMAAPCLLAFSGAELLFGAFLRPFPKGGYQAPLIEVLALAAPLGGDRLAFSVSARAWSLDDPVPPVTEDADLRQRVLMIELVDGTGEAVDHRSVLIPFDEPTTGRDIRWGERQVLQGAEGWISSALQAVVGTDLRARMRTGEAELAAQARRLEELGHELLLAPAAAARCGCEPAVTGELGRRR